jgi:Ni,Fe-hydrogenase III large subunit
MTGRRSLAICDLGAGQPTGPDGLVRLNVDEAVWTALAIGCAEGKHDLCALWFDNGQMRMALSDPMRHIRAIVSITTRERAYPAVGCHHAPAIRLERAMRDLYATDPVGLPDRRPWLDHGSWPRQPQSLAAPPCQGPYPFLGAEGEGLHQIPVGPVHAGIIEPGHFRFTANGEAVVRLEERLGYVHKGIEALCAGAEIDRAGRIIARVSGDSTVAYGFAFARAVEAAAGWQPPERSVLLRGIMAEIERLSHHVNDFGAICNDASAVAIQARCALIREDILQTAGTCFGHRMMMDRIVPGGVTCELSRDSATAISDLLGRCEAALRAVVSAYDGSPSLQDRTVTTGIVKADLVRQFAAGGYIGRATGRSFDARAAFPYPPYDAVSFAVPTRTAGDVDARVWIRIDEIEQSASIIRQLLLKLRPGPLQAALPQLSRGEGAALVEAFRGDVFVSVRLDDLGRIAHLHARDASWFQWPLLESAIEGNIVADFPLCNKSFNCSYSGHDI